MKRCSINAIREICVRCPLAMTEDLLADLVQYKSHRDKSATAGTARRRDPAQA